MLLRAAVVLVCMLVLGGCSDSAETVQIALRNELGAPIAQVWLGSSAARDSDSYGPIAPGATSPAQGFEPTLANYRQIHIVMDDNTRYLAIADPEAAFGDRDLAPGAYVFVLTLSGADVSVTIEPQ